jgi:hypothetical protein
MTLIAALKLRGRLHFAADCMISAPGSTPRFEYLPFSGNIRNNVNKNPVYTLSRLARKLTLLDESRLIMWAGNTMVAYGVIKTLLERKDEIEDLGDAINSELNTYPPADRSDVSFMWSEIAVKSIGKADILMGWSEPPSAYIEIGLEKHGKQEAIGSVAACGSGAGEFTDILQFFFKRQEYIPHLLSDRTGWTGTNPMLVTAAYFCSREYFLGPNLSSLFGVAFEIAYLDGSLGRPRFVLLDRVAFLFLRVGKDRTGSVQFSLRNSFVYQWYENGQLYVMRDFTRYSGQTEVALFHIPTIDGMAHRSTEMPKWNKWQADTVCCFISIEENSGGGWAYAVLKSPDVIMERSERGLVVEFSGEAEAGLRKIAKDIGAR